MCCRVNHNYINPEVSKLTQCIIYQPFAMLWLTLAGSTFRLGCLQDLAFRSMLLGYHTIPSILRRIPNHIISY
jgi:hypothetical protein